MRYNKCSYLKIYNFFSNFNYTGHQPGYILPTHTCAMVTEDYVGGTCDVSNCQILVIYFYHKPLCIFVARVTMAALSPARHKSSLACRPGGFRRTAMSAHQTFSHASVPIETGSMPIRQCPTEVDHRTQKLAINLIYIYLIVMLE